MTDKQKDLWYDDKNDWRRKYNFLVLVDIEKEEELDKLVEYGYLNGDEVEKVEYDYYSGVPYPCGDIVICMKQSQEEIKKHEEIMKLVKDKSYRSDKNIWKFEKNIWYWNENFSNITIKPRWLKVSENMEAIILNKNLDDEYERNVYRGIAFGDYTILSDYLPRINHPDYHNIKQCKNNPTVYIYQNKDSGLIDYVGIVTSKNRTLDKRVLEHIKLDNMTFYNYEIKYFYVDTKADAEIWEAHLINYYNSYERLNKKKSSWGECTFLKGKESEIEWIDYEVSKK